jgi:hypothetical protein
MFLVGAEHWSDVSELECSWWVQNIELIFAISNVPGGCRTLS